jgi:hypothetical protein
VCVWGVRVCVCVWVLERVCVPVRVCGECGRVCASVCACTCVWGACVRVMMVLLLFLQKQNLAFAVYQFGSVLSLPD